jgi:hypothetical protein
MEMIDRTDDLIEALVVARQSGPLRNDVLDPADDVFDAPRDEQPPPTARQIRYRTRRRRDEYEEVRHE